MTDELDLSAIRTREAAATPGPWRWAGNMDNDDPRLVGARFRDVLGHIRRERTAEDRETRSYAEYLRDVEIWDQSLNDGKGRYRSYTEDEITERVHDDWLHDSWGEPMKDSRMALVGGPGSFYREARELAVYEVCREATSREDPRVYRADIVGLRDPNAEFIAHARQDVADLLAEVDRLRAALAALQPEAVSGVH
jgi:hypothetical protein